MGLGDWSKPRRPLGMFQLEKAWPFPDLGRTMAEVIVDETIAA